MEHGFFGVSCRVHFAMKLSVFVLLFLFALVDFTSGLRAGKGGKKSKGGKKGEGGKNSTKV